MFDLFKVFLYNVLSGFSSFLMLSMWGFFFFFFAVSSWAVNIYF